MPKKFQIIADSISGEELFIDPSTGEAFSARELGCVLITPLELSQRKKMREQLRKRQAAERTAPAFGDFVWHAYEMSGAPLGTMQDSNISRLIYLSAFCTYQGKLIFRNGNTVTWKHIPELLRISLRESYKFRAATAEHIKEMYDGTLILNRKTFARGDLRVANVAKSADGGRFYTRVYFDGVRSLYESCSGRTKCILSFLYRSLPYLHREYNVLCKNPLEADIEKIQPITLSDFWQAIGYSRPNASRGATVLFHPRITFGDKSEQAMTCATNPLLPHLGRCVYLNPRIIFSGTRENAEKILSVFAAHERGNLLQA